MRAVSLDCLIASAFERMAVVYAQTTVNQWPAAARVSPEFGIHPVSVCSAFCRVYSSIVSEVYGPSHDT
ncbi:hypothetical protein GJ496_006734 [Pomphorhynchus laevis]|nr:hypothetical protein GJ496_006734 [Pomphorhynchus laevis]